MASDLDTKPGVPKYEAFIDSQLGKVRTRMRALDAGRTLMLLGILTLGYFLLLAAFDLAVKGADDGWIIGTRLAAFGIYVLLMVFFLVQLGLRLYRRINPYYAAKQLEENIQDAKNSVINWLDLKGRELPVAIRSAVGQRAAKELKQTDPDKAVNPKGNWVLGGIFGGLVLGILVLFLMGPNQFRSLVQRAFEPFRGSVLGTKTEITLIKPEKGDTTVLLGQRVDFQATIEGRFPKLGRPGAPRLLYRYQKADSFVPLALDESPDGTWNTVLLGDQVQNGFWYKIAAGDAETPEYQVKVQSIPRATRFEATYHYRPYRMLPDDLVIFPNDQAVYPRLRDYRGTQVVLVVRTNRILAQAQIEMEAGGLKEKLNAEVLDEDPQAMRVHMTLEKRGTFRVLFTSKEGEENGDRSPYQIDVLEDKAPYVVLTKPGQDVSLPANGTLHLTGTAHDDIGIKSMALRLKVLEGDAKPPLEPKSYRAGKSFKFDNGTYPDFLDYQDFVLLAKIKTAQGEPFPLKAGMVLEYWLEARDNSDYPNPNGNLGISETFKVTIENPKDDKKHKEDRQKAEEQQKQHEQQQDKNNAKKNEDRSKNKNKNQDQDNSSSEQNDKDRQDFDKRREQLEKELAKDNKNPDQKNKDQNPGQNKAGGQGNNPEPKDSQNKDQAGDRKDDGKKEQGGQPGQTKDQGKPEPDQKKPGESKDKGTGEPMKDQAQTDNTQADKGPADKTPTADKQQAQGDKKQTDPKNNMQKQPNKAKDQEGSKDPKTEPGVGDKQSPQQSGNKGQAQGSDPKNKDGSKNSSPGSQAGKKEGTEKGPDNKADNSKETDPDAKGETAPMPKKAKGTKDSKEDTQKGVQTGKSGPDGTGPMGDNEADDPIDFKRGADLQLDKLKERMTPEHLKNLGWTEQDWQKFLKDAKAYQEMNRQNKVGKNETNKKATTSLIPGSSLRPIDTNPNAQVEFLQTDRALPPLEFRDAQKRFTTDKK